MGYPVTFPLTWWLWRTLQSPGSDNAIYVRTYHQRDAPLFPRESSFVSALFFYIFIASGGLIIPLVAFWLVGLYCGGVWLWRIIGTTHRYHLNDDELLDVTPIGRLGVLLHLSQGILHRKQRFNSLQGAPLQIIRVIVAFVCYLVSLILLPEALRPADSMAFFIGMALIAIVFMVLSQINHRQAILTSVIIALVAARSRTALLVARGGGLSAYLMIQLITILFWINAVLVAWRWRSIQGFYGIPLAGAVSILLLLAWNECVAQVLWRILGDSTRLINLSRPAPPL
jgi:hypothetical protein